MSFSKKFEDNTSPRTPQSADKGAWGEQLAAAHLVSLGYAIVATQWRNGHYEVDLIAQKGARMVFVEVKTRDKPYTDPVEAVDEAKRRRIIRSADVFLRQYDVPFEYQFDIITIVGDQAGYELKHYPDAFFPSMGRR